MNIRSLFLGSAASFLAVSGARAADAVVVAEPEPVEYVRVCDVYGTGFYYMPGTETCLKVGGYVRYDIGVGYLGYEDVIDKKDFAEDGIINLNDTYYKRAAQRSKSMPVRKPNLEHCALISRSISSTIRSPPKTTIRRSRSKDPFPAPRIRSRWSTPISSSAVF